MELPEGFHREAAVLPVAGAYHRQCGCLHPSGGVCAVSGGDGECLRAVDAHKPVGFATGFGGKIEVVILAARFKVAQSLADSLVCKRAYPKAHERRGAADVVIEIAEDKFSLSSGIGRHDNLVTLVEQAVDGLYLRHHTAVGLVAFLCLDLTGDEREGVGDDGEVVTDKAAYAVAVRHGKLDKVSECPCHGIAASLEISVLSLCRAHDAGNLTCHGWLFCNDCLHVFLLFG